MKSTKTNKYQRAIDMAVNSTDSSRAQRLQQVQKKIDDLKSRGLLKKQEYVSSSTMPNFDKWHYHKGNSEKDN